MAGGRYIKKPLSYLRSSFMIIPGLFIFFIFERAFSSADQEKNTGWRRDGGFRRMSFPGTSSWSWRRLRSVCRQQRGLFEFSQTTNQRPRLPPLANQKRPEAEPHSRGELGSAPPGLRLQVPRRGSGQRPAEPPRSGCGEDRWQRCPPPAPAAPALEAVL